LCLDLNFVFSFVTLSLGLAENCVVVEMDWLVGFFRELHMTNVQIQAKILNNRHYDKP